MMRARYKDMQKRWGKAFPREGRKGKATGSKNKTNYIIKYKIQCDKSKGSAVVFSPTAKSLIKNSEVLKI